jgi:hypothetical protein
MGVAIIAVTAVVFLMYDCFVRLHQQKLSRSANKSNAIVNSLFPENVRDRLLKRESNALKEQETRQRKKPLMVETSPSAALCTFDRTSTSSSPFP